MNRLASVLGVLLVGTLALPGRVASENGPGTPRGCSAPATRTVGRTTLVPAGADLQSALDAARPGDTLSLEAGATFAGPFTLPVKQGNDWIVIQGSEQRRLPPSGTRVDPSHAKHMPKLEADGGPAIVAARGAHHYRFVGVEIRPRRGTFVTELVRLGDAGARRAQDLPTHITLDRCYVHGDADVGARRGVALNSRCTDVESSYFADFKEVGADSQAIAGWSGPGPFRIVNNYLEAAGENLMFGGADPSIQGLVPSDIEVRGNHFRKPLAWKAAATRGKAWSVKNLFELKNARRVLVEGNLFENNWVAAQSGFAILLTVRNQDGGAPWSVVEDVTFVRNVVRHSASGISILGRDDNHPSAVAARISIRGNLFQDIGGPKWGGGGTLLQLVGGAADVVFDHNTAFHTHNVIMAEGPAHPRFVFSNNIVAQNQYGVIGTGTAPGTATLTTYFPKAVMTGNAIIGGDQAAYSSGNFFPTSIDAVGFAQGAGIWPRLGPRSPYRRAATDHTDVGADVDALERSLLAVSAPSGAVLR